MMETEKQTLRSKKVQATKREYKRRFEEKDRHRDLWIEHDGVTYYRQARRGEGRSGYQAKWIEVTDLSKIDHDYTIDATGNACVGDEVIFEQAQFSGSWRKPKFSHMEIKRGKIISDSYGKMKQQHTFTLLLDNGETLRIKGRNLYRNGLHRRPWEDESARVKVLEEKHERGDLAREAREQRKFVNDNYWSAHV